MNCIFCKIAAREISTKIVYEDDATIAFLDVQPRAPGHTLLIPKKHAAGILDLTEDEVRAFFAAARKVDQLIIERVNPDGVTIGINQGKASGQEVAHLHLHFIPRWHNDGGGAIQSVVHNDDAEKREIVQKRLLSG